MSDWEYSEGNLWQSHLKTLCHLSVFSPLLSPSFPSVPLSFLPQPNPGPWGRDFGKQQPSGMSWNITPIFLHIIHSLEHQYLPTIGSCVITLLCLSRNDTGVYVSVKKYLQCFSYIMILQSSSAEQSQLRLSGRFYTTQSQTLQGKRSDFPFREKKARTQTHVFLEREHSKQLAFPLRF